jgi:hypothetical protein
VTFRTKKTQDRSALGHEHLFDPTVVEQPVSDVGGLSPQDARTAVGRDQHDREVILDRSPHSDPKGIAVEDLGSLLAAYSDASVHLVLPMSAIVDAHRQGFA